MKSRRTKALEISKETKKKVWERDNHRCIFCGKAVPIELANSHFVKRSHGGLGIPQNIMTNCFECHKLFDDSIKRSEMLVYAENYLRSKYRKWDKEKLHYSKGWWKHYDDRD